MSAGIRASARPRGGLIELDPRAGVDHATIRIAHYTGYPRVSRGQRECTAIARQASSELSLIAKEPEELGALLRLEVEDLCGVPAGDTLARVVACTAREDGSFEVRVVPVVPNRARFVRRAPETVQLEG